MEEIEYKIYGLKDPTDGIIKYVGVSKNVESRYKQHFYPSNNNDKTDWIDKLKLNDLRPELIILETILTSDRNTALNKEKEFIVKYKDNVYNRQNNIHEEGTKWITLSLDSELKPKLDKLMVELMVIKEKKQTYSEIVNELIVSYNEKNNKKTK